MSSSVRRVGRWPLWMVAMVGVAVAGCSGVTPRPNDTGPVSTFDPKVQRQRDQYGTIHGADGITLFGSQSRTRKADRGGGGGGAGMGVNALLWRASLETIGFMPIASADPFGGLIITDWYEPPEAPGMRVKLNVLIRDTALRADGVKVTVFQQKRQGEGWVDVPVDPATATRLEDQILTSARNLRIAGSS